ncbi:MAG: tetratricopeptide repeat protein [Candidatus Eisenbacteria bacterium]|nr:tetratricopeptide repeat protein [Candidatus Eisenbacteria bacterium]
MLGGTLAADSQSYWDWATQLLQSSRQTGPFFLAPLYPYALAGVRRVLGDSWLAVVCLQAIGGSLGVALLGDVARKLSSPVIGGVVGLVVACFAPLILHDNLILSESLLFLLGACWVWIATWDAENGRRLGKYVVLGVLTGLLAIGRGTQLVLLLALPFGLSSRASRLAGTALAAVVALLVVAPVTLHNYRACHELIPTTYSAGYNMAVGFGPGATGGFAPPTGTGLTMRTPGAGLVGGAEWDGREEIQRRTGRALTPQESSRYWGSVALAAIREDPVRALRLAGLKILMLFNRHEYPQIENLHTYEQLLGPVGLPSELVIPLLVCLSVVGALARGQAPVVRLLIAELLLQVSVLVPFFVTDRYRLHLIPPLLSLGAVGAQVLVDSLRRHDRRQLRRAIPACVVGLALSTMPLPSLGPTRESWGIAMDIGERAFRAGRYDLAIQQLEDAAEIEARSGRGWSRSTAMTAPLTVHAMTLGRALLESGQPERAHEWFLRARRLSPGLPGIAEWIGRTTKQRSEMLPLRERAIRAAQMGRYAEAESLFVRMSRVPDPTFFAWGALVRLQCQTGRVGEARQSFDAAVRLGWSGSAKMLHEALVLELENHDSEARRVLARVDEAEVRSDPTLSDLRRVIRDLMDRRAARQVVEVPGQ